MSVTSPGSSPDGASTAEFRFPPRLHTPALRKKKRGARSRSGAVNARRRVNCPSPLSNSDKSKRRKKKKKKRKKRTRRSARKFRNDVSIKEKSASDRSERPSTLDFSSMRSIVPADDEEHQDSAEDNKASRRKGANRDGAHREASRRRLRHQPAKSGSIEVVSAPFSDRPGSAIRSVIPTVAASSSLYALKSEESEIRGDFWNYSHSLIGIISDADEDDTAVSTLRDLGILRLHDRVWSIDHRHMRYLQRDVRYSLEFGMSIESFEDFCTREALCVQDDDSDEFFEDGMAAAVGDPAKSDPFMYIVYQKDRTFSPAASRDSETGGNSSCSSEQRWGRSRVENKTRLPGGCGIAIIKPFNRATFEWNATKRLLGTKAASFRTCFCEESAVEHSYPYEDYGARKRSSVEYGWIGIMDGVRRFSENRFFSDQAELRAAAASSSGGARRRKHNKHCVKRRRALCNSGLIDACRGNDPSEKGIYFISLTKSMISVDIGWSAMFYEFSAYGDVLSYTIRMHASLKESGKLEKFLCQIAWQIVFALEYVHCRRMLHGDVKPDNILIHMTNYHMMNSGRNACSARSQSAAGGGDFIWVKLGDWEFCMDEQSALSRLSRPGSKEYAAPELFSLRVATIDYDPKTADIFTVGSTIFSLHQLHNVCKDGAINTYYLPLSLPEMANFILACCRPEPGIRPSASELLQHVWFAKAWEKGWLDCFRSVDDYKKPSGTKYMLYNSWLTQALRRRCEHDDAVAVRD